VFGFDQQQFRFWNAWWALTALRSLARRLMGNVAPVEVAAADALKKVGVAGQFVSPNPSRD
jgi:hypothetical protein